MTRIKSVISKEDFVVYIQLENGSSIILNMASRLSTVRFGMLADKGFFKNPTTDGDFVLWGDEVEISLSEVFQLVQK